MRVSQRQSTLVLQPQGSSGEHPSSAALLGHGQHAKPCKQHHQQPHRVARQYAMMEVGSSSNTATRMPSAPPGSSARPLSSTLPVGSGSCPGAGSLRSLPSSWRSRLGAFSGSGAVAGEADGALPREGGG